MGTEMTPRPPLLAEFWLEVRLQQEGSCSYFAGPHNAHHKN
jgi:hypothetical protein